MKFPHIMVDLETLDNVPGGVIMSIGAVGFNAHTGELGPRFYAVASSNRGTNLELERSKETLAWWESQAEDAKEVLYQSLDVNTPTLDAALYSFGVWLGTNFEAKNVCMWSNGADFDLPFLAVAYRKANLQLPWRFFNNRCYRTLKNLLGPLVEKPQFDGTKHNALDDAVFQAQHAVQLLRALGSLNSLYDTYAMARDQPNDNWHNPEHNVSMRAGLFPAVNAEG